MVCNMVSFLSQLYTSRPHQYVQQFKLWNFLIILGVFLAVDVIYLCIWTIWFRFRRTLSTEEVGHEGGVGYEGGVRDGL